MPTVAAVYLLARLAAFRRSAAAWAAGLFALMPEAILQAATDQNDLLLTAPRWSTDRGDQPAPAQIARSPPFEPVLPGCSERNGPSRHAGRLEARGRRR